MFVTTVRRGEYLTFYSRMVFHARVYCGSSIAALYRVFQGPRIAVDCPVDRVASPAGLGLR